MILQQVILVIEIDIHLIKIDNKIIAVLKTYNSTITQARSPPKYGTSGLSFQIVRLLSNQTGFVSGWHSLLEPFFPNLSLVHHVWRTAITKNKDTASNGCIFMIRRGM